MGRRSNNRTSNNSIAREEELVARTPSLTSIAATRGGGDSENVNAKGPTVDQPQNTKRQKTGGTEGRRNRASPARIFKLNKDLNFEQKGVMIEKELGGLLDLAVNSMPGDLSQWIMRHYDPEMSQIVIPERGKIPVDAASVRRIWGFPNRERKKQKKLTGMVHKMCSVISHVVGKLVSWFGRIDDDEWWAWTTDPDDVETSRRQSKRRRQQVPAGIDSLPSDEESFISNDDGSAEDHSENDEVCEDKDNDGSEEDGSSNNDDGDEVGTSVHMGREVEIDGNKDKEDEEEGKEDDDDDEVREMLDIEDRSLALETKRIFEELLIAKDLDLPFTFNPEEICPKEIRGKVMREIGSALEVGEPKQVGHNQVPPPLLPKKKKSVSFILEPIVMNEAGGDPQTFRSENSKYGQGAKARQPAMKKSGASQQQYEAISEVKESSNGIDETQLLNNMLPSSICPGLASKQTGKQASCTQVMATQSKQEASPTAFQPSLAEATLNATRVVPIQVKKGGNTLSVSKAKPGGTQPLDAKHEAKSVSEVVQASSQENLFHLSDVEDRFEKFMSLSGKTTNALEVNVLDVSELLASAMVIAYGGYFVTVRELTKSMKKEGFVLSHVMEVGIQSIMVNLPPDSKKVLMLLRFSGSGKSAVLNTLIGLPVLMRF
ncbi:hypothetical protein ZWY2020_043282 [Hordeum vulgare]|nr:hypothetical protein ZWY2020_043282 [Hordeum vulgare]